MADDEVIEVPETDEEERIVGGIVLRPQESTEDVIDLQADYYTAEDIYDAAHYFMENYWNEGDHGMRVMHKGEIVNDKIRILESYIAPVDFDVIVHKLGVDGDKVEVTKGSWIMIVKVLNDELWDDVKDGGFSGFSFGGTATVETLDA